jgi:hypothetical protein
MTHCFRTGQLVVPANPAKADCDTYEIIRLLQENGDGPVYLVKGLSSGMVRPVREYQVTVASLGCAVSPSRRSSSVGYRERRGQS